MTARQIEDPLTAPHWAAAAEGRLVVQRCVECAQLRWPPLPGCPECLGRATEWVEVTPRGTVWSYVVYHRGFSAALAAEVPYTVLMVQLADGPYLVGRLAAEEPVAVGDRVEAVFGVDDGPVRWRVIR
jgi:uncharacterized OB-fold protein